MMEVLLQRSKILGKHTRSSFRLKLIRGTIAVVALALPAVGSAQLDFADAVAVKIRTYPVKRQNGRPVPGPDGMPQPEALSGGRPANLAEFPAVPVDESFPGGSILDALQNYQKQDLMAALNALLALLRNGYMDLEIEKNCRVDVVKFQYDHQPTKVIPSVQETGLTALMQILADGVKAVELQRAYDRLQDRYNSGLSTDQKRDQEMMALLRNMRLAIAVRYNPRVNTPALAGLRPQEAKERFKAEVAKGKPVEGELLIGPIHLAVKAKLNSNAKKPLPPSCKR
jgi:hypothetical protein